MSGCGESNVLKNSTSQPIPSSMFLSINKKRQTVAAQSTAHIVWIIQQVRS